MDALRKAPSPFTAGVLAGALVCLVASSPWPLVGCLILAAASHAKDAFAGANAQVVTASGANSSAVNAGRDVAIHA